MLGYNRLRKRILENLESLAPELTYHDMAHTLDVLKVCNYYIRRYKVKPHEAKLLRIAALAHDMGFSISFKNHERIGANMVANMMRDLSMKEEDISEVVKLIMATKIGNKTPELNQKIISDADLDYLGRKDYPEISESLFKEMRNLKLLKTRSEWKNVQIKFLEKHRFKTKFGKRNRAPMKLKWINMIKLNAI